ncbi:MAG: glycoside hydrolase family 2 TIM barrel-domain containing protein [Bacteroidales bacterium]
MRKGHAFLIVWSLLGLVLAACTTENEPVPDWTWQQDINFDWRFSPGDPAGALAMDFDDRDWERVDLPHDWAIRGPFGPPESDGNTGKLPWKGEGTYRKVFSLPARADGKRLQFLFDGVMANPTVYLNGTEVGSWRYGYNSFWIDATDAARFGSENVLVVHADTRDHQSRWYPGAGIYRKVGFRLVDPLHIPVWGLTATTPEVGEEEALVHARVELAHGGDRPKSAHLTLRVMDPEGREVARDEQDVTLKPGESQIRDLDFRIAGPQRWDVDHPHLYALEATLSSENIPLQVESVPFGIRTFSWTANDGFHLNGRRVQLQGVNLHHDQGPLGAAFYPRAMERQLEIMKEMGVNALRTSHNACAPEVLDLCDRMGILVFNELFDKYGPTASVDCSMGEFVDTYAEAEVRNFVRRDRNHPSVVIWSIGNEIAELLTDSDGRAAEHVAHMVSYFKTYDPTRPTTMGCHIPSVSEGGKHILDALETTGWNYARRYVSTRKAYPDMPLIYSESASAFGTRGAYKLPLASDKEDFGTDGELTAYMLTAATWSDIPEIEFEYMRIDTFLAGEFVWTGFDYLGEPTPVIPMEEVPWGKFVTTPEGYGARSSYFGIVDLAGLPKDSYYNYRSLWKKDEHTLHLTPHWNWAGHEGQPVPVCLYTDGDEAELFLNGRSLGRKRKSDPDRAATSRAMRSSFDYVVGAGTDPNPYYEAVDAYRLRWMDVPYEAGELKAVVYKDGQSIGSTAVRTAGDPARLALTPDRSRLRADGFDLCYVTVDMVDGEGVLCPLAMDTLRFEVEGPVVFLGVANGDQMGHDIFTDATHPLFYGKAVVVLRSKPGSRGSATLHVRSVSGMEATAELQVGDGG